MRTLCVDVVHNAPTDYIYTKEFIVIIIVIYDFMTNYNFGEIIFIFAQNEPKK